jgi:hypothetical protein
LAVLRLTVLVVAVHGAPGGLCGYAVIAPRPGLSGLACRAKIWTKHLSG